MFAEKIELIQNTTIKAQFKEINKCIENESYRAAIVLLWSTVVLDLIIKVQELKDVYSVPAAGTVIDELEKEWADKPTSAEWENKILIDCRDRIQNISQVQCETLSHLHKIRHLCAHPVKDATWDLYKPKRNEILYFFEYAIDMAIVPAYLNKKNFGDFLEDISKNYPVYENEFAKYVEDKYFKFLDQNSRKYYLKNLWKICFKLNDVECQKNRKINICALESLMKLVGEEFVKIEILNNNKVFSDIELTDPEIISSYIQLSVKMPYNYRLLEEITQIGIKNIVSKSSYYATLCFFIQPSFEKHLELLEQRPLWDEDDAKIIDIKALSELIKRNDLSSIEKIRIVSIAIRCYIKAYSYDYADDVFKLLIVPNLPCFTDDQIICLVDGIENNHETYERKGSRSDHPKILEEVKKRNFDQSVLEKMEYVLSLKLY